MISLITDDNNNIMGSNPFFSGRIPQNLYNGIEDYRKETGESKTEILVKALAQYIGYKLEEKEPSISPIQEKFDDIFNQLEKLEKLDDIFNRLEKLEKHLFHEERVKTELTNNLKQLEITYDNNAIISETKSQILSTREIVELLGISRASLGVWKNKGLLPKEIKGYRLEFDHSETKPRNSFWKVTKLDN